MLGLGEKETELFQTMDDLREVGCEVLTMGQYLRPSPKHLPVVEYITPEQFNYYGDIARGKGFLYVASGPLVRSSYHAADFHPVVRDNRTARTAIAVSARLNHVVIPSEAERSRGIPRNTLNFRNGIFRLRST